MRRFAIVVAVILFSACGPKPAPAPPPPLAPPPPPPPAPMNLADVAGKWTVQVMPQVGDSTLLTYTLEAKADTSGWTFTFPGRKPMPVHVMVSGDSLMMDAGPYASVLRAGTQVTTHGVSRLVGGKLVGMTVAHYKTSKSDSVRTLRVAGSRMP